MEPQIISSYSVGAHSADLEKTVSRLEKEKAYKDLSTIMIVPALGSIPTKVVASWMNLYTPPNQRFVRLFAVGMEVGKAFSSCIDSILSHPELSSYKYVLTLEHDNIPPPDAIPKILARMEEHPEFSAIGGLYFTKGWGGHAQIWGDPKDPIVNCRPQLPDPKGGLVECVATGMGFTLFRMDMFKDSRLKHPRFVTGDGVNGDGLKTQDIDFWLDARKYGHRCAIDCGVKVGHYDLEGKFGVKDFTW